MWTIDGAMYREGNVIMSPHIGNDTAQTMYTLTRAAEDNVQNVNL